MSGMLVLGTFIGLSVGNFGLEILNKKRWTVALERSYFQGVALLAIWLLTFLRTP